MEDKDKDYLAAKAQEQAEQTRRAKAKIRTIRIWFWVVILMFLGFFRPVAMRDEQAESQRNHHRILREKRAVF